MNSTLNSVLIGFAPFIAFFVILFSRRTPPCPDCGQLLPRFILPFKMTKRHWFEGGCLCPACGCDVDIAGKKVPAGTPVRFRPLVTTIVMATLVLGLGVVLVSFLLHKSAPL